MDISYNTNVLWCMSVAALMAGWLTDWAHIASAQKRTRPQTAHRAHSHKSIYAVYIDANFSLDLPISVFFLFLSTREWCHCLTCDLLYHMYSTIYNVCDVRFYYICGLSALSKTNTEVVYRWVFTKCVGERQGLVRTNSKQEGKHARIDVCGWEVLVMDLVWGIYRVGIWSNRNLNCVNAIIGLRQCEVMVKRDSCILIGI